MEQQGHGGVKRDNYVKIEIPLETPIDNISQYNLISDQSLLNPTTLLTSSILVYYPFAAIFF